MQTASPIADSLNQNYHDASAGTTGLYASIDELTPSDVDYIETPDDPDNLVYVAKITALIDPISTSNHRLKVRAGTNVTGSVALTAELRQGYISEVSKGELICTLSQSTIQASGFTTYEHALSTTECNQITDYSNLYIRIVLNRV